MAENIIIADGKLIENQLWKNNESITVQAGGTLADSKLTYNADSLVLEKDAVLSGTITVGTEVTLKGNVNAKEADIEFDISGRKEEDSLLFIP